MKKIFISLVLFTMLLLPAGVLAHGDGATEINGMHMGSGNWGMMGFGNYWSIVMSLTWIIWLVVGVLLIIWLWKKVSK